MTNNISQNIFHRQLICRIKFSSQLKKIRVYIPNNCQNCTKKVKKYRKGNKIILGVNFKIIYFAIKN